MHVFIPFLHFCMKERIVPSFITIVLVDPRFRDVISKGDSVDLISKSSHPPSTDVGVFHSRPVCTVKIHYSAGSWMFTLFLHLC